MPELTVPENVIPHPAVVRTQAVRRFSNVWAETAGEALVSGTVIEVVAPSGRKRILPPVLDAFTVPFTTTVSPFAKPQHNSAASTYDTLRIPFTASHSE